MISVYPGAQSSVSADTAADFVSAEPGISPSAPLLPEDSTDPAYAAAVKRAAEAASDGIPRIIPAPSCTAAVSAAVFPLPGLNGGKYGGDLVLRGACTAVLSAAADSGSRSVSFPVPAGAQYMPLRRMRETEIQAAGDFQKSYPGTPPECIFAAGSAASAAYGRAVLDGYLRTGTAAAPEGTPEPADPVPDPEKAYSRYAASRRKTGRHLRAEKILTRVLAFAAVAALALLFFLFFLK